MTAKELTDLVGTGAAVKLMKAHGGGTIYIPSPRAVSYLRRNKEIFAKYIAGITKSKLKKEYELSGRQLLRIITEYKENAQ